MVNTILLLHLLVTSSTLTMLKIIWIRWSQYILCALGKSFLSLRSHHCTKPWRACTQISFCPLTIRNHQIPRKPRLCFILWKHISIWICKLLEVKLVSQLCPTLLVQFSRSVVSNSESPGTAAHQAFPSIIRYWILFRLMSIESVMPSNHLILCHLLLLLPSIFVTPCTTV